MEKNRLYIGASVLFLLVILLSLIPQSIPYVRAQSKDYGVWTFLDASDKGVEVIGEKIGSQQEPPQPFAGWYTDTMAVDPDTNTIVVAWAREDINEYGDDYVYLAFLKPIDADQDGLPEAFQKTIKFVAKTKLESLDSLTIGTVNGRKYVLLTWTYTSDKEKNNVGAAVFTIDGKRVWSGDIANTEEWEEYSRSCYIPAYNDHSGGFLVIWYSNYNHKNTIQGRWIYYHRGWRLSEEFNIVKTNIFYDKADQMLCIGGTDEALVVYRIWDSSEREPDLYAALVDIHNSNVEIKLWDYKGVEETIGVKGAYLNGYFVIPILSGTYIRYQVISEKDKRVVTTSKAISKDGSYPYIYALSDRLVLTWTDYTIRGICIGNIDPINDWSIVKNCIKLKNDKVYHPIIYGYELNGKRYALLTYTMKNSKGYSIGLMKLFLGKPSDKPELISDEIIIDNVGDQIAHGIGVLTYQYDEKYRVTYLVPYTDTSDGEEDFLIYIWFPENVILKTDDINYYKLPDQKDEFIDRLFELVKESDSVKIAVAYWSMDGVGKDLANIVRDKGEEAYVVLDDDDRNKEVINYLNEAKVNVVTDNNMPSDHIMHDKFMILYMKDTKIIVLLTANIGEEDFTKDDNVVIIVNSPSLAYFYEEEFNQLFKGYFGENKEHDYSFVLSIEWGDERIVFEGVFSPTENGMVDKISQTIYGYISRAKTTVSFTSYIFTTSGYVKPIYEALIEKAKNGLSIVGVFDEELNTDTPGRRLYWFLDNMTQYENLQIYVDNHMGKMHAKLFVIDQNITIMGSYNPTKSATRIHDEYIIIIREIGEKGVVGSFFNEYIEKNLISRSVLANTLYEPTHLIIRRVLFRGLDDLEWVEIYNPTDQEVDLSNYVIGDADNLLDGDNEGMYKFPSGTILSSKESLIVTTSIKKFYDIYGVDENWRGRIFEFSDSDSISSNDLIPYNKTKFTGEFSLDDNGDEVILARDENGFLVVVDAVWYGDSTYMVGYEGEPKSAKPLDIGGNGNIVIKEDDKDAVLMNEKYALDDLSNNPVQSIISLESNSTLIIYAFDPDKRDSWVEEVKIGSFSTTSNNRTVGIDLGSLAEKLGDIGVYDVVITVGEETPIPEYRGLRTYTYTNAFAYNETISGDYMYCVSENGGLERIIYESIDAERHEIIVELNNVAGWINITIPSFWNTSTLRVVVDGSQYDGFIVENGIVAIELENPASEIILFANTTPNNPVKVDVKLSDNGDKIIVQAIDPDNKYVDVKVTLDKETIQKSGTGSVEVFINSPLEEGEHTLFIEVVEETPSYVEVKHEFTYKVFVEKINKTEYIITLSQAESLSVSYKVVNTTVHKIEILVTTEGEKDWVYVSKPSSWKKIKAIYINGVDVTNNKELWRIEGNIICVDPSTSNITIIGEIPLGGTAVILNNLVHIEIAAFLLTALMILLISGAIVYRRSSKIKLIDRKS